MNQEYFAYVKGKPLDLSAVKRVLLIQLGDIGDVVYTFPCARAIKETCPDATLFMAVQKKAAGLMNCCPWVSGVVAVDKKKRSISEALRYQLRFWFRLRRFSPDLTIDLRTSERGAIMTRLSGAPLRVGRYTPHGKAWRNPLFSHLVHPAGRMNQYISEYYLDTIAAYGITTKHLNPELRISSSQEAQVEALLNSAGIPSNYPLAALQPFSLWNYKELTTAKYVELIRGINRQFGLNVILIGSPAERDRCSHLVAAANASVHNLAGLTDLANLGALFRKCVFFVGVDSAGLHIAAAAGVPTVGIFGPSSPEIWAPRGNAHIVVRKKWACVPCKETGCEGRMRSNCLDQLTVDEVIAGIHALGKPMSNRIQTVV